MDLVENQNGLMQAGAVVEEGASRRGNLSEKDHRRGQ